MDEPNGDTLDVAVARGRNTPLRHVDDFLFYIPHPANIILLFGWLTRRLHFERLRTSDYWPGVRAMLPFDDHRDTFI